LEGNCLLTLQVQLVRATSRLTDYFGQRFAQETPAIHRLPDCSVPFEVGNPGAKEALTELFGAASEARKLQAVNFKRRNSPFLREYPGIERGIEAQRLHHKLLTLIVILLGRRREAYNAKLKLHVEGRGVPVREEIWNGTAPDSGHLRLDAVQWMSELLWYTIRYWIPCYPTTAEMAFELSLLVDDAPPRRAELAQAAQAMENFDRESLAAEVRSLIAYCDQCQSDKQGGSKGTRAFYYGVATALQHQFDLFKAKREVADPNMKYRNVSNEDHPVEEGHAAEGRTQEATGLTPPIVFTTNFDNALEQVFAENGLGFHVVYPMLGDEKDRPNGTKLIWWLKTSYPKSSFSKATDVHWDSIVNNYEQPDLEQIVGPMIVKLHGAPCMEKPVPTSQWWMVLSEVGYLQALGGQASIPSWLNQQLGNKKESRRALWFLGYSISDWNVRLRLFEHIKVGNIGARSTVDREKDPYRTALLKNIKVQHWVEDLTRIPDMIFHMFTTQKFRKSDEVVSLTQKLSDLLQEKS
jgi:hypothetical protein